MEKIKNIATFCLTFLLSFSIGAFATACNEEETSSSHSTSSASSEQTETQNAYTFTVVYQDGTPAEGMMVQICKGNDLCLAPVSTNAQGIAVVETSFGEFEYDIHILNLPTGYTFSPEKTPATYGEIVITLTTN